jgi:hypothetical protein
MKKIKILTIMLVLAATTAVAKTSAPANCAIALTPAPVNSDYWAATDALGRKVGTYDGAKNDKKVILFYWTWHQGSDAPGSTVKNISEIVHKCPEAMMEYDNPLWTENSSGHNLYWWEQPLLGYYRTTDKWVLRKHAEMLADAHVDAVFFDCTNGSLTWDESTDALMETWDKAQKDGVNVPKIGFLLPFGANENTNTSLRHLYEKYYSKGLYKNLWFYWDGKPCIMAYPDALTGNKEDKAIKAFFTFRPGQPDYVTGPAKNRNDQWGWLENYPQHGYVKVADGKYELVTVGVSQNACPETQGHCSAFNKPYSYGRTYTKRKGFDPRVDGYLYGWNFAEQWDRAYELDPKAVFVTGWNEWIAGRWTRKDGWTGDPFSFVDEFDWAHSRDIEPVKSWGDRGDVYYMQLVDRVRKFKGTEPQPKASAEKTIDINNFNAWQDVAPFFAAYKGNTVHRDSPGRNQFYYTNNSGRNDITGAKVARDANYLYFYVQTAENLTPSTDHNWMMLFIDTDRDKATGWNGYDYIVNYKAPKDGMAYVQKSYQNKWIWQDAGIADLVVKDNMLVIKIPRNIIALNGKPVNIEFKWNDNMQDDGNIMDFYVNGDTAPGGRFNYVYSE